MSTAHTRTPLRTEVSTADMDQTRELIDRMFGARVNVGAVGTPEQRLDLVVTDVGAFSASEAGVPGRLAYRVTGADFFVISTVHSGHAKADRGPSADRYGTGGTHLANYPGADFSLSSEDIQASAIRLPQWLLAEAVRNDPDAALEVPVFTGFDPLDGDNRRWRRSARFAAALLADPATADAALVIGSAARLLAATALHTFPNNAVPVTLSRDRNDSGADTLRRSIAFMEANPDMDIDVADVARAANISVRAVQLAFRRGLGLTPTAYLRRVRLDQARDQLIDADPADGLTVARVATDWGFPSPSRFARHYREAYGELPSDSLNR